ncbi:hypothetical protein R1sor_016712 [Riccia sorocarpa]|uniref:Uncharacterized protein n=1 Tax=Riccia sorocarpa TaxID=122646 RepID=A0ABD3HG72_9MARC
MGTPISRVIRGFEAARERMLRSNTSQKVLILYDEEFAQMLEQRSSEHPAGSSTQDDDSDTEADGFVEVTGGKRRSHMASRPSYGSLEMANRFHGLEHTGDSLREEQEQEDIVASQDQGTKILHEETKVTNSQDSPVRNTHRGEGALPDLLDRDSDKKQLVEEPEVQDNELAVIMKSLGTWAYIQEEEMLEQATRGIEGRPMDADGTPDKGNKPKRRVFDKQPPEHQRVDTFS